MKKLIPLLFLLSSCTAVFRGTLLDIEEASVGFAGKYKGERIIKEILPEDGAK